MTTWKWQLRCPHSVGKDMCFGKVDDLLGRLTGRMTTMCIALNSSREGQVDDYDNELSSFFQLQSKSFSDHTLLHISAEGQDL